MVLMPISSYPAPSDDFSQSQVLEEKKSGLTQQAQTVEQSNMGKREKRVALSEIDDKISETNTKISQRKTAYSLKRHRDNEIIFQRQIEQAEKEKKELSNDRMKLDKRA